jgi:hypothetical protein
LAPSITFVLQWSICQIKPDWVNDNLCSDIEKDGIHSTNVSSEHAFDLAPKITFEKKAGKKNKERERWHSEI